MPLPLVSCLCITRNRLRLLQRAVACFQRQTYAERELVAIYESDDVETAEYLQTVASDTLRVFEVGVDRKRTLGELRNHAVQVSRGAYVCQWDDDDWYRDDRLAVQMQALLESGQEACVLSRWICLDALTGTAYIGRRRAWEGSLLCQKSSMPPYRRVTRSEDTPVVEALQRREQLLRLDRPEIYVYTFHGGNTWDRTHWKRVVDGAVRLNDDETRRIIAASGSDFIRPVHPAAPSEYLTATRHAFEEAMARRPSSVRTSWFRFAGMTVRFRVVGSRLAEHMNAAFEHLRIDDDPGGPAALSVDMWDRAQTALGCPGVPFAPDSTTHLDDGLLTQFGEGEVLRYERPRSVTCFDRRASHILSCRHDGDKLALYERGKPFPIMLAAWYQDHGVQQVHAGLVSRGERGVLFIGAAGSGKSTCALACTLADFDYLGDDYVGLQMTEDGAWWGYSYYAAARIDGGHLARFPQIRAHEVQSPYSWESKSLILMPRVAPGRMASRVRVAAVVMPRIASDGQTRLAKASKVEAMISLASSTLRLPLSPALSGWNSLSDFIERMPCYRLDIGEDLSEIPGEIRRLLGQAAD